MNAAAQQAKGVTRTTGSAAVPTTAITALGDPHQVVPTNPRRTSEEHDAFFDLFYRTRRPYRVQGSQMSPRYAQDVLIWATLLDRSLEVDMVVIIELRTGERMLGQVNAANDYVVEIVNCWRGNRIGIPRSEIEAILLVMGECTDLDDYDPVTHQSRQVEAAECPVQTEIPGWLWHRQRELPFLAADRCRDPWSTAEQQ